MDSLNYSTPFNTPIANVNSWGNVTDNFGNNLGNINRYGSFQDNLSPYSNNIDSLGTVSTGLGTPILKLNNYSDYLSNQCRRDAMDYVQLNDYKERYAKPYEAPWERQKPFYSEPEVNIFKSKKEEYNYNLPVYEPLYTFPSIKKKNVLDDDFSYNSYNKWIKPII